MINDLDATLKKLLEHELPSGLVDPSSINFAVPDDKFLPTVEQLPAINLFLYDLRENWELRSNEWQIERHGHQVIKHPPPVRVDCSYLITAWAGGDGSDKVAGEHRLLGEVMKVLLRHRKLPEQILQESLRGQEPPLRARVMQAGQLQSIGEFWQAMGGQPRAALHYTVTISVDVGKPVELGPPVSGVWVGKQGIVDRVREEMGTP